jgi:Protein of unknown function (DUF2842)
MRNIMSRRTRKFIGAIVMLTFVTAYALVVMTLAQPLLTGASKLVQGIFYAVAGLLWVLPVLPLISWMDRPDKDNAPR